VKQTNLNIRDAKRRIWFAKQLPEFLGESWAGWYFLTRVLPPVKEMGYERQGLWSLGYLMVRSYLILSVPRAGVHSVAL